MVALLALAAILFAAPAQAEDCSDRITQAESLASLLQAQAARDQLRIQRGDARAEIAERRVRLIADRGLVISKIAQIDRGNIDCRIVDEIYGRLLISYRDIR